MRRGARELLLYSKGGGANDFRGGADVSRWGADVSRWGANAIRRGANAMGGNGNSGRERVAETCPSNFSIVVD